MSTPAACAKVLERLDAYLSRELSPQFSGEVEWHLKSCPDCGAEFEVRKQIRAQLQDAVRATPVPPGLDARIRGAIRTTNPRPRSGLWAVAAAAIVILCFALVNLWRMRADPLEAVLRKTPGRLAAVLNVGLRDHLQCAVFRKYPRQPDPASQMAADLGAEFAGIVPLVQAKLPRDFRVIQGHQCSAGKRQYTHLIISGGAGEGKIVSVILTRREPGESLSGGIHQVGVDRFQVVGFESHGYLAYVISDLDAQQNLQWAANLAPTLREYIPHTRVEPQW